MSTRILRVTIPDGLSEERVLAVLHDHDLFIQILCPDLLLYICESGSAQLHEPTVYIVTGELPYGEAKYMLTLTNVEDGIMTRLNAKPPVGAMQITCKWTLVQETEKLVLREHIHIVAHDFMRAMLLGSIDRTRPEQQKILLQHASKAQNFKNGQNAQNARNAQNANEAQNVNNARNNGNAGESNDDTNSSRNAQSKPSSEDDQQPKGV